MSARETELLNVRRSVLPMVASVGLLRLRTLSGLWLVTQRPSGPYCLMNFPPGYALAYFVSACCRCLAAIV